MMISSTPKAMSLSAVMIFFADGSTFFSGLAYMRSFGETALQSLNLSG